MRNEYESEAAACRTQAQEFAGRPEETFLLRLASAFEEIAQTGGTKPLMRRTSPRRDH